jgi:hypothetical protein
MCIQDVHWDFKSITVVVSEKLPEEPLSTNNIMKDYDYAEHSDACTLEIFSHVNS